MRTKRKTVIWICQSSGSNRCLEKIKLTWIISEGTIEGNSVLWGH